MKLILSIFIATLYLAFNIGLTLSVHQCNDVNELSIIKEIEGQSAPEKIILEEVSHSCCVESEESEESSCCSIEKSEADCCFNKAILFQVVQEQVISKAFLFFPIIENANYEQFIHELAYNSVSHEQYIVKHPPPLIEQKTIMNCSLIFYG